MIIEVNEKGLMCVCVDFKGGELTCSYVFLLSFPMALCFVSDIVFLLYIVIFVVLSELYMSVVLSLITKNRSLKSMRCNLVYFLFDIAVVRFLTVTCVVMENVLCCVSGKVVRLFF